MFMLFDLLRITPFSLNLRNCLPYMRLINLLFKYLNINSLFLTFLLKQIAKKQAIF